MTPTDEVTSVSHECGHHQDERTALSSTLTSDVNESEQVDDKGDDDVLCDLLSRHRNNVRLKMFGDAREVVDVLQIDDTQAQNSLDQVPNNSGRQKNTAVAKCHLRRACHKTSSGFSSGPETHKLIDTGLCLNASSVLTSHRQTHTGYKQHKCDVCQKTFTKRDGLKTHLLTHTGERPHKCNVCQKAFAERGSLKRHMLTHTDERSHKCDVCQKTFTKRNGLQNHMLIHTGERPYKCDVCQKNFTECGNLQKHMLTHSGERPHKCDVCQKTFIRHANLKTRAYAYG